jgi:TetR/AcrR family transcriptional regulator, cholesterol catabolism regulator
MTAAPAPQPLFRLPIGGTDLQSRIADAATELFYSRGAFATTVRDITAACGLTPGSLYNHFASKEQLLYLLIRDTHLQVDEQLAIVIADAEGSPGIQLAGAVRLLVAQSAGQRARSRVANREYTTLAEDRRREITMIRRRMRDRLTDVLEAGLRSEEFALIGRQDHAAAALTANVIATMCANISEWSRENHPLKLPDLQDQYVQMSLRLVGAQPQPAG